MDDKKWERLLVIGFILAVVLFCVCACNSVLHISDLDWESKGVSKDETLRQESLFWALPAIFGAAASVGSGIFNYINQKNTQEQIWNREDNAVSRRAEDLERAGLSKTLAAGSAATTSVVSPPQYQGNGVIDALNAAMQFQGIKNAKQENANMQKSYQVMNSQIDENYSKMFKNNAETNYFNAMANNQAIQGQLLSQQILESFARIENLKHQNKNIDSSNEKSFWEAAKIAQEMEHVQSYGSGPNAGGTLGFLSKSLFFNPFKTLMNVVTGSDPWFQQVQDNRYRD